MTLNDRLQHLRELAYGPVDLDAWASLWHALGAWPDRDTLPMAQDYARPILERGGDLGLAGEVLTFARALGGNPRTRRVAREVLEESPRSLAGLQMASTMLDPHQGDDLAWLAALSSRKPRPTLINEADALYDELDPALIARVRADLDVTIGLERPWREHLQLGRPFMAILARWQREQTGPRILDAWSAIRHQNPDDPMAAWLLIECESVADEDSQVLDYHGNFSSWARPLIEPLCHFLILNRWAAPKAAIKWLSSQEAPEVAPGLLYGLSDHLDALRGRCVEGLLRLSPPALAPAALMIKATSDRRAAGLAQLLERAPDPAWIDPIEAALSQKRSARIREALQTALTCARLAALAPEGVKEGDPRDGRREVEALVKQLPDETAPAMLPMQLKKVRWAGEKRALSPKAVRWLLKRLSGHRFERGDGALAAIRPHLDDADCASLADLVLSAYDRAGRPAAEALWVIHAEGLLGEDRHMSRLAMSVNEDGQHKYDVRRAMEELRPHILAIFRRRQSPSVTAWLAWWSRFSTGIGLQREGASGLREAARQARMSRASLLDRDLPRAALDEARAARLLARHLQDAIDGRRGWEVEAWRSLLVDWPVGRRIARGLLFEVVGEGSGGLGVLDEEGCLVDARGSRIALGERARVFLPSGLDLSRGNPPKGLGPEGLGPEGLGPRALGPRALGPEGLAGWRARIARPAEGPDQGLEVEGVDLRPEPGVAACGALLTRPLVLKLAELGYAPQWEEGRSVRSIRDLGQGVEIALEHEEMTLWSAHSREHRDFVALKGVVAAIEGQPRAWDLVPARVRAVASRDLKALREGVLSKGGR